MDGLKIVIIGAGSTYTPELIDGFIQRKKEIPVKSFYLMDIDKHKLEVVGGLAKRMLDKNNSTSEFVLTDDLEESLKGADFVLTQIRVGGLDARITDEKIPLKYGLIGQETTGVGGFMKALRTIPVIMDIAEKMKRLCPDAWLINFTNPSGIITETIANHTNIKVIGLCNGPYGLKKSALKLVPKGTKKVELDYVGLNHLAWVTSLYCDEKEVLQEQLVPKGEFKYINDVLGFEIDDVLKECMGGIPSGYLAYYYFRDNRLNYLKSLESSRGEVCKDIEDELLELYQRSDINEKPKILDQRGGAKYSEVAVSLIDSIYNDKSDQHVVSVKNNGALDFMAEDDIVEINCTVNKSGAIPIPVKSFDNMHIINLMQTVKSYEKLTVLAGIQGDYQKAVKALLAHPLVGDYEKTKGVLDEMLEANKEYLGHFFNKD